jgi:hypothetical protein
MGEKIIEGLRIDNLKRSIQNIAVTKNPKGATIIQISLRMSVIARTFVTLCCFKVLFNTTGTFEAESEIVCPIGMSMLC